jgi:hypothetical protein
MTQVFLIANGRPGNSLAEGIGAVCATAIKHPANQRRPSFNMAVGDGVSWPRTLFTMKP